MLNQELYPLDLYNVTFYTTNISVCNKDLYLRLYFFCWSGKGKALALGRMWRRDGVLAVSMAQEGVLRSKI